MCVPACSHTADTSVCVCTRLLLHRRYVEVMFSTGPMYVTVQYVLSRNKQDITVLPADVYGKYDKTPDAYLKHLHGSSWHGNDARYFFWLEHYGLSTLAVAGLLVLTAVLGFLYVRHRRAAPALPVSVSYGSLNGQGGGTGTGTVVSSGVVSVSLRPDRDSSRSPHTALNIYDPQTKSK